MPITSKLSLNLYDQPSCNNSSNLRYWIWNNDQVLYALDTQGETTKPHVIFEVKNDEEHLSRKLSIKNAFVNNDGLVFFQRVNNTYRYSMGKKELKVASYPNIVEILSVQDDYIIAERHNHKGNIVFEGVENPIEKLRFLLPQTDSIPIFYFENKSEHRVVYKKEKHSQNEIQLELWSLNKNKARMWKKIQSIDLSPQFPVNYYHISTNKNSLHFQSHNGEMYLSLKNSTVVIRNDLIKVLSLTQSSWMVISDYFKNISNLYFARKTTTEASEDESHELRNMLCVVKGSSNFIIYPNGVEHLSLDDPNHQKPTLDLFQYDTKDLLLLLTNVNVSKYQSHKFSMALLENISTAYEQGLGTSKKQARENVILIIKQLLENNYIDFTQPDFDQLTLIADSTLDNSIDEICLSRILKSIIRLSDVLQPPAHVKLYFKFLLYRYFSNNSHLPHCKKTLRILGRNWKNEFLDIDSVYKAQLALRLFPITDIPLEHQLLTRCSKLVEECKSDELVKDIESRIELLLLYGMPISKSISSYGAHIEKTQLNFEDIKAPQKVVELSQYKK
ncbi:MAG: hypothetical protein COA86_17965 [Kangiella sp.]|nr:MAG: hypothetical protein COA86_17965 [Kangiella sp.]